MYIIILMYLESEVLCPLDDFYAGGITELIVGAAGDPELNLITKVQGFRWPVEGDLLIPRPFLAVKPDGAMITGAKEKSNRTLLLDIHAQCASRCVHVLHDECNIQVVHVNVHVCMYMCTCARTCTCTCTYMCTLYVYVQVHVLLTREAHIHVHIRINYWLTR